jgi:hypothetical protein
MELNMNCIRKILELINITKSHYHQNLSKINLVLLIPLIFFLLISLFLIQGCASTGGYQEAIFKDETDSPLRIYGLFDKEFASKYFGSFRFVFENERDEWLKIENIRLSFPNDSAQKYIKVLDQLKLEQWGKAVRLQKNINESTVKELQSALISAGSSISGMVGDISESVGLDADGKKRTFPENHLYAEDFVLPPGFTVEKWVLLQSSHHEKIPYITNLDLDLEIDKKTQRAEIQFRNKSLAHNNFIWFDPNRDVDLNFYFGASIGSVFPMGEFKESANKKENLINSFGINGYLAILNHFGINFSLDYRTFEARAKLQFRADSLALPGTDFSFSNWENFMFLVSPRFVIPLTVDVDLFAELSVGFSLSRSPTIIAERAGLEIAELEGGTAFSFAGGGSFGSRFYLSDKLNLDIKLEFIPFIDPTFTYTLENNEEINVTQKMSQFKIKATVNWDL